MWAADGLRSSRGDWLGGCCLYLGGSHANLLPSSRVEKKPQKSLPSPRLASKGAKKWVGLSGNPVSGAGGSPGCSVPFGFTSWGFAGV